VTLHLRYVSNHATLSTHYSGYRTSNDGFLLGTNYTSCVPLQRYLYGEYATGCMTEKSWLDSPQGQEMFLFSVEKRPSEGPLGVL